MPVVTLVFAGIAALFNLWLATRCSRLRISAGILHGDGGNALLQQRMRAQLNFVESAPFVLILTLALELAGTPRLWLAIAAALFMAGRVAHAFGMDSAAPNKLRMVGIGVSMLVLLLLAVAAIVTGYSLNMAISTPASIGVPV